MTEDQQLIEQLRRMVLAPGRSFRYREDVAAVARPPTALKPPSVGGRGGRWLGRPAQCREHLGSRW